MYLYIANNLQFIDCNFDHGGHRAFGYALKSTQAPVVGAQVVIISTKGHQQVIIERRAKVIYFPCIAANCEDSSIDNQSPINQQQTKVAETKSIKHHETSPINNASSPNRLGGNIIHIRIPDTNHLTLRSYYLHQHHQ